MQPSFVAPPVPEQPRPFRALAGDALRRPGGRRAISVLSVVLFLAGVVMFAYPVGTDLYSSYQQNRTPGATTTLRRGYARQSPGGRYC